MEFWCYSVHSKKPEDKEPLEWYAIGSDPLSGLAIKFSGGVKDAVEEKIRMQFPEATIVNAGWILEGEQAKLLEPDNKYILEFNVALEKQKIQQR